METYYVVKKGFKPGIYKTWNECKVAVDGFSGPIFKKLNETGHGSIIRATMTNHQVCSSRCSYCSTIGREKKDSINLDEAKEFFGLDQDLIVRPENIRLAVPSGSKSVFTGEITEVIFLGNLNRLLIRMESGKEIFVTEVSNASGEQRKRGQQVGVEFDSALVSRLTR
jgi:ABC-type Fe3+/spermidine/putrescine transport system ATPase subunit